MTAAVEELLHVDPGALVIGPNVRTDTHPDAREFAGSIKARGVVEVITAYRADDGGLVVLRGQRRAVVAAQVGTPTGTVAVRVVPAPPEVDRITDQMSENLHRAVMHEREVRDGIEQLALCGVSAAQIAKRTALKRGTVDAALTVVGSQATKARMDDDGLTLDQAAIFAEFEGDDQATEKLTRAVSWNRPLAHVAQQLRDAAAEAAALAAEAERLRAEGLPALDPTDLPADWRSLRLDRLVSRDGEPIPEQEWPSIPGAAVVVAPEWRYPNHQAAEDSEDEDLTAGDDDPITVFIPVWICTDPDAAGLRDRYTNGQPVSGPGGTNTMDDDETVREAKRVERRRVIANNAAWRSAEAVRREWLAGFVTRKTPPAGAEALVCAALVSGDHIFTRAMQDGHRLLCTLLGKPTEQTEPYYTTQAIRAQLADQPTTPKAATMLALACVVTAWEESTNLHTWRHPGPWDARIMTTLTGWGYAPSDVETLLITDTGPRGDGPADPAS
jgi:ParB family chromosome partitioning protein